jgi:hypothetical protein
MAAQFEEVELEEQALSWPEKARAIRVSDQETYDRAAALLISVGELEKKIIEHHRPIKESAYAAHKAAVAAEKRLLDPLAEAKGIIKRSIASFEIEQERIRREAEQKAREESARLEEEARLKLALQAEEMGAAPETVQEIIDTPIPMTVPPIQPMFSRAAGISTRKVWKWEVVNEAEIPRQFLMIDRVKINGIVRAMGASTKIPGIRIYEETGIAVRR